MVKLKIVKSAGRFGARYGQHIKRKIVDIESRQRKKQKCPFCSKKVKRLSKGIWKCKSCKKKFAAHAYYIEKDSIQVKQEKENRQPIKAKEKQKKETKTLKPKKTSKTSTKLKKPTKKTKSK
jgi:large subunit ribosomal protein L37Ae